MKTFGAIMFWTVIPAIVLVPFWVVFGRLLFGVGGWMMLVMIFTVGPLLVLYHIVVAVLAWLSARSHRLSIWSAITLAVYYVLVFVFGISVVDGGDTSASIGSVLTTLGVAENSSTVLYGVSVTLAVITAIALLVMLIIDIVKKHHATRASQPAPERNLP